MTRNLKYAYIATLIVSILLYAIPFEFGGNTMRWLMALATIGGLAYVIRQIWVITEWSERNRVALLFFNALAILHFILIFVTVVIDPTYLMILIIGVIIATLVYYVVNDRMNRY